MLPRQPKARSLKYAQVFDTAAAQVLQRLLWVLGKTALCITRQSQSRRHWATGTTGPDTDDRDPRSVTFDIAMAWGRERT